MGANYPIWMPDSPINSGTNAFKTMKKKRVYNRTGGALTVGGIYQFDHFLSNASAESGTNDRGQTVTVPAVTTYYWDDPGSAWNNIVAVGTRGSSGLAVTMFTAVYCMALTAAADNAASEVLVMGESSALLLLVSGVLGLDRLPRHAGAELRNDDRGGRLRRVGGSAHRLADGDLHGSDHARGNRTCGVLQRLRRGRLVM